MDLEKARIIDIPDQKIISTGFIAKQIHRIYIVNQSSGDMDVRRN